MRAFIALGSNLGNPVLNCRNAIELLRSVLSVKKLLISKFYQSKPLTKDLKFYPSFVNAVVSCEIYQSPYELLQGLNFIEIQMGRKINLERWAPRLIDLDILFLDHITLEMKDLNIPHKDLHVRDFVLKPLCDIMPEKIHPIYNQSCFSLHSLLQNHYVTYTMQV